MTSTVSQIVERLRGDRHDPEMRGDGQIEVADVTHDHRQVGPGSMFCTVPGGHYDGHDFFQDAVARGASVLLVERWLDSDVAQVKVASTRRAMASAAACVHGDPSDHLTLVGVTGTNGKTTVSYFIEGAIAAAGRGVGVVGTVEARVHGRRLATEHTTPESTDLQRLLATMRGQGADAVVMEVSSHGLDMARVDALSFDVAVFTNLSQDHLDWHGSMEAYFAAKQRLFVASRTAKAVVNVDDAWGLRLIETIDRRLAEHVITLGRSTSAQVRIRDEQLGPTGATARLESPWGDHLLTVPLAGDFNVVNAALAFTAAALAGIDPQAALAGIAATREVPGRFERVHPTLETELGIRVFVDYAHTPGALDAVIAALRTLTTAAAGAGRVIVVAGAGGDRDRGKRHAMGEALSAADVVLVTSDNPRTEDPLAIIDALCTGIAARSDRQPQVHTVVDRREAIETAVDIATAGDVVLIAGKGHETTQEFADRTVTFDDRQVAHTALSAAVAQRHAPPGEQQVGHRAAVATSGIRAGRAKFGQRS